MAKKVRIDKKCIGCSSCVKLMQQVFRLGKDNKSYNKLGDDTELPTDLEGILDEALLCCPVDAIIVENS